MTIPKIIHQIWLGPKAIPWAWANTWKEAHPDWEYRLWTESDIGFSLTCLRQYLAAPRWAAKADILRYEILLHFGGIYLDIDSVNLRPLDDALLERDFVAAWANESARPGSVATGTIGCRANHPIINDLVTYISRLDPEFVRRDPWSTVGPWNFSRFVLGHRCQDILPSHLFYPHHHSGRSCSDEEFRDAYCVQLWGSTGANVGKAVAEARATYGFETLAYAGQREVPPLACILVALFKPSPDFETRLERGMLFLFSDRHNRGYLLSPSAELIWRLFADGARIEGVVEELKPVYPDQATGVSTDVYDTVCKLIEWGALKIAAPP